MHELVAAEEVVRVSDDRLINTVKNTSSTTHSCMYIG